IFSLLSRSMPWISSRHWGNKINDRRLRMVVKTKKKAAAKTAAKKKTTGKKKITAKKKTSAPAKRKASAARVKKGDRYQCSVCGIAVRIDETCGCVDMCDIICCDTQMRPKKK
ncbi:MAG: hypothetical protein JSU90_11030, partial [Nitrospiraceae bacterium]